MLGWWGWMPALVHQHLHLHWDQGPFFRDISTLSFSLTIVEIFKLVASAILFHWSFATWVPYITETNDKGKMEKKVFASVAFGVILASIRALV